MDPYTQMSLLNLTPFLLTIGWDRYEILRNKKLNSNLKGMVLVAKNNMGYELAQQLICDRARIANFFSKNNISVDWVYKATSNDLEVTLNNPEYQSIALLGHSTRDSWVASDRKVTLDDIEKCWNGEKKDGYWVQWGCGDPDGKPLGYDVMKDKSKILGRSKPVTPLHTLLQRNLNVLTYEAPTFPSAD
jgi:hypothetical protein